MIMMKRMDSWSVPFFISRTRSSSVIYASLASAAAMNTGDQRFFCDRRLRSGSRKYSAPSSLEALHLPLAFLGCSRARLVLRCRGSTIIAAMSCRHRQYCCAFLDTVSSTTPILLVPPLPLLPPLSPCYPRGLFVLLYWRYRC